MDKDWAARNRVNGNFANLDASVGGKIAYAEFVHTFDSLIPQSLYGTHPEYFPLINGKRVNGYTQRCLTNPEVLKLAVEGVRKAFKDHPEAMITSVSQNDTAGWCQCENCKRLTEQYGANSGLYLWFVNQVAEQIDKALPGKLIDTLAYQFTEAPPKGIAPRANVRVRLCPISVCEAHPYENDDAPATKAFISNLAAWSTITSTLYIWHYNTDFAHYLMPFPDFAEFPADLKLYQRSGVKGVFFEGDIAPGGGASDAEGFCSYVMAKLLWNPNQDADAHVTEWLQGVYPNAWKPMRTWFDLMHTASRESRRPITWASTTRPSPRSSRPRCSTRATSSSIRPPRSPRRRWKVSTSIERAWASVTCDSSSTRKMANPSTHSSPKPTRSASPSSAKGGPLRTGRRRTEKG